MNIHLLTDQQLAQLRHILGAAERVVVCAHKSPDGDAIGSCLGWSLYLQSLDKESTICIPDAYPDFLMWLPGTQNIIRHDKHPEKTAQAFSEADLVCCLDFGASSRVEDMEPLLTAYQGRLLMIDHHLAPTLEATLAVSCPRLSSASELVFRIVWQLGAFEEMDKKWATCIYCGMMTDTGGFTYNSTDPAIYFIISQLLTKQIDKDKIYRNVFNNYSPWAIRFRGYVLSRKLHTHPKLHAAYFTITRKEMNDFHFIKGDLEGLVNEPLRIRGMRLSISLREDTERPNLILVSLRSVDDFPCNKVAEDFFNGGGHLNASGGKLHCSLREAEQTARKAIEAYAHLL